MEAPSLWQRMTLPTRWRSPCAVMLVAVVVIAAPMSRAGAAEEASAAWLEWPRLTGDWGGLRADIEDLGFSLHCCYAADYFTNARGGLNTSDAHVYRGLLNLALTIDTEALQLIPGGTVFVCFQNIHGRDISERHVGDLQALNNIDAPDRTQVSEYGYEQSLLNGMLRFKLGKMDANADFALVEHGLEFINSSPGVPPNIPLPTYPETALGAAVFIEPVDWFSVAAGVYDAQGRGDRWGFDTAFHGRNDSVTLVELAFKPVLPAFGQDLPGAYRVGGWYHSGTWEIFREDDRDEDRPPPGHRGNAGVYLGFDQLLWRENPGVPDDRQGLAAFFQFSWAPSAYNEISQYYGGGFACTGLIPTRDEDVTGVGLFHASLSGRIQQIEARYSETAVELFHRFQLTPFMSVKPDAQYIVNPGGDGRDALALGVRLELVF